MTQNGRLGGMTIIHGGPKTGAKRVENEISSASQTVAVRSTRDGKVDKSITSYGDNSASDIGGAIKIRRRGEGDAVEEVLRRFDCVDLIPTGRLAFEEIDGAQTFELRTGDEIEWCNGVDSDP